MSVIPTNHGLRGSRSGNSLGSRLGLAGHLMVMGIWLEFRFKNTPHRRAAPDSRREQDKGEK